MTDQELSDIIRDVLDNALGATLESEYLHRDIMDAIANGGLPDNSDDDEDDE